MGPGGAAGDGGGFGGDRVVAASSLSSKRPVSVDRDDGDLELPDAGPG